MTLWQYGTHQISCRYVHWSTTSTVDVSLQEALSCFGNGVISFVLCINREYRSCEQELNRQACARRRNVLALRRQVRAEMSTQAVAVRVPTNRVPASTTSSSEGWAARSTRNHGFKGTLKATSKLVSKKSDILITILEFIRCQKMH